MGSVRKPPREGQRVQHTLLMEAGPLKGLASGECALKAKVQIREVVGIGAEGLSSHNSGDFKGSRSASGLMVVLGYEESVYITFSVTAKPRTHTSELETVEGQRER